MTEYFNSKGYNDMYGEPTAKQLAEDKVEAFVQFAQSIYREQKPYADFGRYARLLTNYLHAQFGGVVMPNNWEVTLGSIKDAWDNLMLCTPEVAIKDALEDVLYEYVMSRSEVHGD